MRLRVWLLWSFMIVLVGVGGAPTKIHAQTNTVTVVQVIPTADATNVATHSTFTVVFSQPVVPLSILEDQANLPQPFSLEPNATGTGEWLNPSIYVFRPSVPLEGGQTYTAQIASFISTDGSNVAPYQWQFTTQSLEVVEVTPSVLASGVLLDQAVELIFNQPFDLATLQAAFQLLDSDGNAVEGTFSLSAEGLGMSFQPLSPLQINSAYRVLVSNPDLSVLVDYSFTTVPYPAIISTYPLDDAGEVDVWGIDVYFASPMDEESFRERVQLTPEPPDGMSMYFYTWDNSLRILAPFLPSTNYVVTIDPGLRDIYGNEMSSGFELNFTTAPLPPEVTLEVPSEVGFYNANSQPQLYISHRNADAPTLEVYQVRVEDLVAQLTGENQYSPASSYVPNASDLRAQYRFDTPSPLNVRRFELVDLSTSTTSVSAVSCEGALPSRIVAGDIAKVITAPDPLRVRASAPEGEILELLYEGASMQVFTGPICIEGIAWFEILLGDGRTGWIAEGASGEYYVDRLLEGAGVTDAVTVANVGIESSGIYFLRTQSPSIYYFPAHFMIYGTTNLTIKSDNDRMLVWATDVNTGLPVANAILKVYGNSAQEVGSGITDAQGLAEIPVPPRQDYWSPLAVVASDVNGTMLGVSATDWTNGIDLYEFNIGSTPYQAEESWYLYTDRPIYRPEQTVYFRGITRQRNDLMYAVPTGEQVQVFIDDYDGNQIYDEILTLDRYGAFHGEMRLPAEAGVGSYTLRAKMLTDVEDYYSNAFFSVAEYRAPEFSVTLQNQIPEIVQGQPILTEVNATYYSGGAVSDASLDYSVTSNTYFFDYQGEGSYRFRYEDPEVDDYYSFYYGSYEYLGDGVATTNADGQATLEWSTTTDQTESRVVTVEANLLDETGFAVSGRTQTVVHAAELYVGVKTDTYIVSQGDALAVDVIAVDWNSRGVANQAVDVVISRMKWSTVQEQDADGVVTFRNVLERVESLNQTVSTDQNGQASLEFTPTETGQYQIVVEATDAQGNLTRASQWVWVSGDGYVNWGNDNHARLDLVTDKNQYQIGDVAKVLIPSPYQTSVQALVTVERGNIYHSEIITLASSTTVYEVPILPDYSPNIFVTATLVKGVDETNPIADFRFGVVELNVANDNRLIYLDITADSDQSTPGETVTYTVQATDEQGQPVQAQVGVSVADLAVLSLSPFIETTIQDIFFGQQPLQIRTSSALTRNVEWQTEYIAQTIKGGGGGGGGFGIFEIRNEFVDTPYWNPTLETDATGKAQFTVTLPDNLTTWRLDARALTAEANMRVGQNSLDVVATKPLYVRPVTPRFFVVGDEVMLSAVVNNNSGQDQTVAAQLEASGVTLLTQPEPLVIADGQRGEFIWQVQVQDVEAVDLTFIATSELFGDASKPLVGRESDQQLPVYRFVVPETVGTAGVLTEAQSVTESIQLPQSVVFDRATLDVSYSSTLVGTLLNSLEALTLYSDTFTEASVSRLLANVAMHSTFAQLGETDSIQYAELDAEITLALQVIQQSQNIDGGWGWISGGESTPLVTAYAVLGLAEAQRNGYTLTAEVLNNGRNYLWVNSPLLYVPRFGGGDWQYNQEAWVLYALAQSGGGEVARMANLYDQRARLNDEAKAFLAMALFATNPDDTRLATLMSDLVNTASTSATGIHWNSSEPINWTTDNRATAVILKAFIMLDASNALIPNGVRYLVSARRGDYWESSQETTWSVLALRDWLVYSNDSSAAYTANITLNNAVIADQQTAQDLREAQATSVTLDQTQTQYDLTLNRSEGQGNLYYTAHLNAWLAVDQVQPISNGLTVLRRYTLADQTVQSAKVGEEVTVRLSVVVPQDSHFVTIHDPLPAGLEAIDTTLATSQQVGTTPDLQMIDPVRDGWGWWYFSNIDIQDEQVVLSSEYLPAGTYEYVYHARATVPGVYRVMPPTAQEQYFPEVYGRGAGSLFTVNE